MKDFTIAIMSLARSQLNQTAEQVSAWGSRLATWLLVGNAGALVLAIQALRESETRFVAEIAFQSGRLFASGLAFAFAGAVLSYFALVWALWLQGRSSGIVDLYAFKASLEDWRRARGEPLSEEEIDAQTSEMAGHTKDLEGLRRTIQRGPLRASAFAVCLLGVSAGAFVWGVSVPLSKMRPRDPPITVGDMVEIGKLAGSLAPPEKAVPVPEVPAEER